MVHVAYCFDKNYRQHFGASMTSLLLNFDGPGSDLCIHVITDEMDHVFQTRLNRLQDTFKARIEIHIPLVEDIAEISRLQLNSRAVEHVTMATYFRLLLAKILSSSVDRVLYLDADTIILSSVRELFNTDMENATLAGAPDLSSQGMSARLQLQNYINSGVLLIDLKQWRQRNYTSRCLDYAARNPEKLLYADQCTINIVLADSLYLLDGKWNRGVTAHAKSQTADGAGVLHFITRDKPWHAWYENSLAKYYWRYLEVSPWAGALPVQPSTIEEARRMARLSFNQGNSLAAVKIYESILDLLPQAKKTEA